MIPLYRPLIDNSDVNKVCNIVESTWITNKNPVVSLFEKKLGLYTGVKHCISVNNGSSACIVMLKSLQLKQGSYVIVPTCTYAATAFAINHAGHIPIFVDCDDKTWLMDTELVEKALNDYDVKCIISVDVCGNLPDKNKLRYLASQYDTYLLSDSCEGFSGFYNDGTHAGAFADAFALSFYANKQITCGEGGAFLTNNTDLYKYASQLCRQGSIFNDPYTHNIIGHNFRMTAMQAAIGVSQFDKLSDILLEKNRVFNTYYSLLKDYVDFQEQTELNTAKWMFAIRFRNADDLDKVTAVFRIKNIEYRRFFNPLHKQQPYSSAICYENGNAQNLRDTVLFIPSYPGLSQKYIEKISNLIIEVVK